MEPEKDARWHVGKEIPITLIVAFIVQTVAFGVSYGGLANKVDALLDANREFRQDRYTRSDGDRDRQFLLQVIAAQAQRDADQDRRMSANDNSINELRRYTK